jgi:hypothetical protein
MYTINVSWSGGPKWNSAAPSSFNPNKTKSATEHLIETGGQSIDEAIMAFDTFRSYPITVIQDQPPQDGVNWVTSLVISESDSSKAIEIKNKLLEYYSRKQKQLETDSSGYKINISVV